MFEMRDFKQAMNLSLNDIIRVDEEYMQVDLITDPTRQVRSTGYLTLYYCPIDRILSPDQESESIVVNRHLNVAVYRWVV